MGRIDDSINTKVIIETIEKKKVQILGRYLEVLMSKGTINLYIFLYIYIYIEPPPMDNDVIDECMDDVMSQIKDAPVYTAISERLITSNNTYNFDFDRYKVLVEFDNTIKRALNDEIMQKGCDTDDKKKAVVNKALEIIDEIARTKYNLNPDDIKQNYVPNIDQKLQDEIDELQARFKILDNQLNLERTKTENKSRFSLSRVFSPKPTTALLEKKRENVRRRIAEIMTDKQNLMNKDTNAEVAELCKSKVGDITAKLGRIDSEKHNVSDNETRKDLEQEQSDLMRQKSIYESCSKPSQGGFNKNHNKSKKQRNRKHKTRKHSIPGIRKTRKHRKTSRK